MQHDLIWIVRRIMRISFAPIVANCIRKYIPIAIERRGRNRASYFRIPLEPVLRVLVPEVECTIGAGSAESAVHGVEADGVDAVHFADVSVRRVLLPVALEGEVRTVCGVRTARNWVVVHAVHANVRCVFVLHVLDCTTPFYAADCETGRISEARYYPCLPFQVALHCFVEFHGVVQIDDVAVPVGGADDEELVFDIHCVDAFLTLHAPYRLGLPQVPIFHRLVP